MPLQREAPVDPLVLGVELVQAILLLERAADRGLLGSGGVGIARRAARRGRASRQLAGREIAEAETVDIGLVRLGVVTRIGNIGQNAEGIVGEGVAEQDAAGRNDFLGVFLPGARHGGGKPHAGVIERLGEQDVDGRADRVGADSDVRRLHHVQLADEIGAYGAEVDRAATGRRRDAATVKEGFVEVPAEAANRDAGRFAACAVALDRHAGQALQRGRDVRVREFADVFRRNGIHDPDRIALDVQVALERSADAGDDDVFFGCRGGSLRRVLCVSWRSDNRQTRRADQEKAAQPPSLRAIRLCPRPVHFHVSLSVSDRLFIWRRHVRPIGAAF